MNLSLSVLPIVMHITVNLPDETHIILKVRGPDSKTVAVSAKPCVLTLIEEDYDEESAASHVKRLLDIIACTTCFGPSNGNSGDNSEATNDTKRYKKSSKPRRNGKDKRSPSPPKGAAAATSSVDEDGSRQFLPEAW
ncbi:hypothetical protein HAX54_002065 [Datura stramonium]|uniref:Uncharacterized protein n=1 Tax=Datura stramonium TaxID=4076 RepID=A0ABS8T3C3_DATST|nr:hypothetical protein [Datura stramonium]